MRPISFKIFSLVLFCLIPAVPAFATDFAQLQGIVHDPQHRPVAEARVTLSAAHSDFREQTESDSEGRFAFVSVALGEYTITVAHSGFGTLQQPITLHSGTSPVLH